MALHTSSYFNLPHLANNWLNPGDNETSGWKGGGGGGDGKVGQPNLV